MREKYRRSISYITTAGDRISVMIIGAIVQRKSRFSYLLGRRSVKISAWHFMSEHTCFRPKTYASVESSTECELNPTHNLGVNCSAIDKSQLRPMQCCDGSGCRHYYEFKLVVVVGGSA